MVATLLTLTLITSAPNLEGNAQLQKRLSLVDSELRNLEAPYSYRSAVGSFWGTIGAPWLLVSVPVAILGGGTRVLNAPFFVVVGGLSVVFLGGGTLFAIVTTWLKNRSHAFKHREEIAALREERAQLLAQLGGGPAPPRGF